MTYQTLIIIGAPRSGTNMLRDVLCELQGVDTWPCDEINYIWRHGNVRENTDEFGDVLARPNIKSFIRGEFNDLAKKTKSKVLVEKTCANSLRIPFVDAVLPEAKYIFIYRDGVDVVGSAKKRWKAKLDIPYILRKVRYVPLSDLPYYALRYFWNRLYKLISRSERLSFWGPQFKGLEGALSQHSLEEVCALQWERCVDLSEKAFSELPSEKVVRVSYEGFVSNPSLELTKILKSLDMAFDEGTIKKAVSGVSSNSIGKGRSALSTDQLRGVEGLISDSLKRYGYE